MESLKKIEENSIIIKEHELFGKYKSYFKMTIASLNEEVSQKGKQIPSRIEEVPRFKIEKVKGGRTTHAETLRILKNDYARFIFDRWDKLKSIESYTELRLYLVSKKYMGEGIDEQGFLINPLIDFCSKINSLSFSEPILLEIYSKIEEYIFADKIKYSCSTILTNFESDVDEISIEDSIKIHKYTEDECREIWQKQLFKFPFIIVTPEEFKLEVIIYKDKSKLRYYGGEGHNELKNVLTLLRLFKTTDIITGTIETKPLQWVPLGGITSSGIEKNPGGRYSLSKAEIPKLTELWDTIKNIDYLNCPSLEIAIHRFNFAHERSNLEDKIIDIMIGFEALYSDGEGEIRYKNALMASILIGECAEEKEKIFKILQIAYDVRSKLVHGKRKLDAKVKMSSPLNVEYRMNEFINIVQEYLSRSIKKIANLSTHHTLKQIWEQIHTAALVTNVSI